MSFIITVVGALLIIEGIPYFVFPKKVKDWAALLEEIPDRSLRVLGIVSMASGLALLYFVRFF